MKVFVGDQLFYQSQPRQTVFHASEAQCRLYGGAAGGGKTEAILWEIYALGTNSVYKKLRGAVFRKTIPDIEKYFVERALEVFPAHTYRYNKQKRIMTFLATGSQVEFNYCESESDLRNYQGAQWDFLAIDEFTQHSEYVFKYLFMRMRTRKPGWKVKFFGGSNPGGIGHTWVKRIWIDRERTPEEEKFVWAFIPARLEDNPKMLEINPHYEDQLMMLPDEVMRKALRWGDWNIFAGQFFSELRQDLQGFNPFEIPRTWNRYLEIDYGYDHPSVCHWNAVDEEGDVWKYKELVVRQKTYTRFAEMILEMCEEEEKFEYAVADPSIWAKKGNRQGLSGAEEMQNVFDRDTRKIVLTEANNDRVNGWGIMREWIKPYAKANPHTGQKSVATRMHISTGMTFWWKKVPELQRDPKKPEDVLKSTVINPDGTIGYCDDSGDATRYGCMSRPYPSKKKPAVETVDRYGQPLPRKPRRAIMKNKPLWQPEQAPQYYGNR